MYRVLMECISRAQCLFKTRIVGDRSRHVQSKPTRPSINPSSSTLNQHYRVVIERTEEQTFQLSRVGELPSVYKSSVENRQTYRELTEDSSR